MCSNAKQMIHPTKDTRGVVVVVHGLNLNPDKMKTLASIFIEKKVTPIYIHLTGHTERSKWKFVSAKRWRQDLYKGLCQAYLISKDRKIPMYGLGYSLGSVVLQDAIEKFKVPFKSTFHISPAFETRWYTGFITALFKMGLKFDIPSSNFVEYRAKSTTSLLAYKAMWELNDKLKHEDEIEKTILMDHRDELVDFTSTRHLCNKIKNCTFLELKNQPFKRPKTIYHLSIDPQTTGEKSWQFIRKTIISKIES
jgi:alpha-beta hydrolase superfamily lysophospholipase